MVQIQAKGKTRSEKSEVARAIQHENYLVMASFLVINLISSVWAHHWSFKYNRWTSPRCQSRLDDRRIFGPSRLTTSSVKTFPPGPPRGQLTSPRLFPTSPGPSQGLDRANCPRRRRPPPGTWLNYGRSSRRARPAPRAPTR